jgi:hypothetical protein
MSATGTTAATAADLSAACWALRAKLDAARKEHGADAPELRRLAQAYIDAAYAWQRARYGKVRAKLSVAALLR